MLSTKKQAKFYDTQGVPWFTQENFSHYQIFSVPLNKSCCWDNFENPDLISVCFKN
jgi:hypothetical protein